MGTIIYENRNRIVELENSEERINEHIGIMTAISLIALAVMAFIIRSSLMDTSTITEKIVFAGSLVLTSLALIWSLRTDKKESDVKTLLSVGIALMIPVLL